MPGSLPFPIHAISPCRSLKIYTTPYMYLMRYILYPFRYLVIPPPPLPLRKLQIFLAQYIA